MRKIKLFEKGHNVIWDPRRKKDILLYCHWIRRYGKGPFKIHDIHKISPSKQILEIITKHGLVKLLDYWLVPA